MSSSLTRFTHDSKSKPEVSFSSQLPEAGKEVHHKLSAHRRAALLLHLATQDPSLCYYHNDPYCHPPTLQIALDSVRAVYKMVRRLYDPEDEQSIKEIIKTIELDETRMKEHVKNVTGWDLEKWAKTIRDTDLEALSKEDSRMLMMAGMARSRVTGEVEGDAMTMGGESVMADRTINETIIDGSDGATAAQSTEAPPAYQQQPMLYMGGDPRGPSSEL